jgi:hypothetical protein
MPPSACPECDTSVPSLRKPANWRQALWGGWTCPHCRCEFDRWGRKVATVPLAFASDPAGLSLSDAKLRRLRPDLYGWRRRLREKTGWAFPQRDYVAKHLRLGDSRAALAVSAAPLLVAAYSDELDAVALLRFPDGLAGEYGLRDGSRLLSVNSYRRERAVDADLTPGPGWSGAWTGFMPVVAEFVSDDAGAIEGHKRRITEAEWRRADELGREYLRLRPGVARDGRPIFCASPAEVAPEG